MNNKYNNIIMIHVKTTDIQRIELHDKNRNENNNNRHSYYSISVGTLT